MRLMAHEQDRAAEMVPDDGSHAVAESDGQRLRGAVPRPMSPERVPGMLCDVQLRLTLT